MNFAWNVVLRSTVILSGARVVCLALRRASASTRHAVWAIALVCTLLLPLAPLMLPELNLPLLQPQGRIAPAQFSEEPTASASTQTPAMVIASGDARKADVATPATVPVAERVTRWSWQNGVMMLWVMGFILVGGQLVLGIRKVQALSRTSGMVTDPAWLALVTELRSSLSISASVDVRIGSDSLSPMTSGMFHNLILLPAGAAQWTAERRRFVLAHELAHVKRRDGILQVVVETACALHWFNPMMWHAAARLRLERERACDDHVLKLGADADRYASHLLDIAREIVPSGPVASASMSMIQPSQLETRLRSIVDDRRSRKALSRIGMFALLTLAAVMTALIATVHLTALPLPDFAFRLLEPPSPMARASLVQERISVRERETESPLPDGFVKIAPGEFTMGCSRGEACSFEEAPPHKVQITKRFEIGKYEVTQSEWQAVMGTNPSDFKGEDLPVEQVSWNDVQEFLRRMDARRDGYHYRLPYEAEWEYAARAGEPVRWMSGPSVPPINGGFQLPMDPIAWYGRNSEGHTHPVGQKQPNAWGLYDMFGNVEELIQDWYSVDYFANSPVNDPAGPLTGVGHVVRGGPSWDLGFAPTFRHDVGPDSRYDFLGFRLVREAIAQQTQQVPSTMNFISYEKEIAMGRELASQAETQMTIVSDAAINEYINGVVRLLVRNSDAKVPYNVKVVKSDAVNPLGLPGGFLYLDSATILNCDSEAELAAVIAHLMAHINARHGAESNAKGQILNVATVPLVFSQNTLPVVLPASGSPIPSAFYVFSLKSEGEADFLATQYIFKAGYDPSAWATFSEKLGARENARPGMIGKTFVTHPMTSTRAEQNRIESRKILPDREHYVLTTPLFEQIKRRVANLN